MANTKGLPKVAQYVKNVGKSVAFAAIGSATENTEGIRDFVDDNKEVFAEIYAPIANWRETLKKAKVSIEKSNIYKAVDYGVKNLIDDIKTGNFYNDRSYDVAETSLGLDDESLGMDFDYGGSDDDFDDDDDHESSSDRSFADSFNKAIGAAATTQSTVVAQGTDMIIKANKASTAYIGVQIEKSAATISSSMGAVYNVVDKVNQFLAGPMRNHLENTRTYQENSLKIMQEQQAMIKELLEMQRNIYKAKDRDYRSTKLDDSMTSNGNVNLAGYFKNIKSNLSNLSDEFGLSMLDLTGASGMNPLLLFAAAPMKIMIDGMIQKILPKNFKSGLKSFDHGITTLFSQFIAKMNNASESYDDDNALMSGLAKIFGVKVKKKDNINPSNFVKGPVPFDGITRQTIIEVIPGYLARIEASLTGSSERYYDNNRGTWKSAAQIQKEFEEERARTISYANMDLRNDLQPVINEIAKYSKHEAEAFEKSMHAMMEKLYEDFGDFKADLVAVKNEKTGKTEYRSADSSDAWLDYGYADKESFDMALRALSPRTIRNLASSNMMAREQHAKNLEEHEADGGIYTKIFNATWDNKGSGSTSANKPSEFKGKSLLSLSTDEYGNNIFHYLREILTSINTRHRDNKKNKKKNKKYGNYYTNNNFNTTSSSRESETKSESEDDPGSYDSGEVNWSTIEDDLDKEAAKAYEESKKKKAIGDWITQKLEKSTVGKFFNKAINGVTSIISSPFKFATELLEKANENMFTMMFGDKDYSNMKDDEGNPINNVFQYMIYKVNKSFKELTDKVGGAVRDMYDEYLRPFVDTTIKPIWEQYAQPVFDEVKGFIGAGVSRAKKAFRNTFGNVFRKREKDDDGLSYEDNLFNMASKLANDGVVGADEVEKAANNKSSKDDNGFEYENGLFSAKGRLVTKRGLTMISPGEMIIPASFDSNEQNKMLNKEKKDRSRILNAFKNLQSDDIGLNAKGTVDTGKLKEDLQKIYKENTMERKAAKVGAGGILGGLAGLLTGINPLLGAAAGAGISILNNSDTLKNLVFGEVIDDEGNRKGGIVSQKIQKIFTKALPDMGDFGIAGGLLGLFTPFGPLGGAAIGAGIGYLKNSESFKKFIFGDEASGEEGLIKKESYEKFKALVKKSVPNILIGAGAGVLAGPFGLLGNAAMGAGLGLLTSTDTFHKFVFGDENSGGIVSAFKNGILDPAKDHIINILADFKDYARKNIFEPLKTFWDPFKQSIKNIVKSTADKIKDHLNDMFERTIGIPMADFLQEKIFKPLTNTFFKVLKLPIALGKTVLAAPFKLLGGIGNSIRSSQIRRGTAYDMSASERLAYRDQHKIRFGKVNGLFHKDKMLEEDMMLANMNDENLSRMASVAKVNLTSKSALQNKVGKARQAVGREVSAFFNAKGENGKSRYSRVHYNDVKEITEYATNGDLETALYRIDMLNLTDAEKEDLINRITEKSNAATKANEELELANTDSKDLDKELSELLGHKVKNRKHRRQIYNAAEAELRARGKAAKKATEDEKSPEQKATDEFAQIYNERSQAIIKLFETANQRLAILINPEEALKDSENTEKDLAKSAVEKANKPLATSEGINKVTSGDDDSLEATEQAAEENEDDNRDEDNLKANKETNTILTKLTEGLFGKDKKEKSKEDKKSGILGKIFSGMGKVGKFLGIGGLSLTGLSLFGHATQWFTTSVLPKLKDFLFGTKADDGSVVKEGFLGHLKTIFIGDGKDKKGIFGNLGGFLFGEDGKSGPLSPVANFFKDITENGIGHWIGTKVLPNMVAGWGYAMDNVVTPAIALLVKHAPSMLGSLAKAIINGVSRAFGFEDVFDSNISSSDALKEYQSITDSNKERLSSKLDPSVVELFSSSSAYKAVDGVNINADFSSSKTKINKIYDKYGNQITESTKELNYETAPGMAGLTGAKTVTNDIYYDENGNIARDDYRQFNRVDTIVSALASVANNGFIRAAVGALPNKTLANLIAKIGTKGVGKGAAKVGTGIFGKAVSATGKTITKATSAGAAVNNAIEQALNGTTTTVAKTASNAAANSIDDVVEAGIKSMDNATEAAIKAAANSVDDVSFTSKLVGLFKRIGDSDIGNNILKFCSPSTTKAILNEALEKMARKLGDSILAKATTKVVKSIFGVLGKFSPASIVFWVSDFAYGYNNAETLLGVARDDKDYVVGGGVKCICGLLNLITNQFTLGLIPVDIIIDAAVDFLFPLLGIDASSLKAARERAYEIMEEHNKANPDNPYFNLQDYNNKDKFWYKAGTYLGVVEDGAAKLDIAEAYVKAIEEYKTYRYKHREDPVVRMGGVETKPNLSANVYAYALDDQASTYIGPYAGRNMANQQYYSDFENELKNGEYVDYINHVQGKSGKARTKSKRNNTKLLDNVSMSFNKNISKTVSSNLKLERLIVKDKKKISKALDGNISVFSKEYWENNKYDTGSMGTLANSSIYMEKILNMPIAIVKEVANTVSKSLTELKKFFGDEYKTIWNWFSNFFKPNSNIVNASRNLNYTSTSASKAAGVSGSADAVAFGEGRKFGLGHTYQSSDSISGIRYGDSTIGESGCAPVAATNLINSLYNNGGTNVMEAASFAERNNMTVPGGGTDIGYFNSFLGSKGIPTTNTNSGGDVMNALRRGNQVIMLGRDSHDNPGAPFGTTPHYVTAKGISPNGNIIAEDPDLPYGNIEYNPRDMMNSMITSVIANTGFGRNRRRKKMRYGKARTNLALPVNGTTSSSGSKYLLGPDAIIRIAKSQVGIEEGPNINQCKYNDAYYGRVNSYGSSYHWCVVFVWWVFNQAGASKLFMNGERCAGTGGLYSWYSNRGKFDKSNPKPGDIMIIDYKMEGNRDHAAIVEAVNGDTITIIDGNYGNRGKSNGIVANRDINIKYAYGFCHIDYPYEYDSSKVVDMTKYGDTTDYEAMAKSSSYATGSGTSTGALLSALSSLGKDMIKGLYGNDAYAALFGDDYSTTTGNTGSSNIALTGNTDRDKIWNYLTKSAGYTKNAASGIVGCWEKESKNNPRRIEGDYLKDFPGYDEVINNRDTMNKWAERLFRAYKNQGLKINEDAYKGNNGHYYPGIGLAQWTGNRGYNLFKHADKTGANWGSLENQLAFFDSEISSRGIKDLLNKSTSPEDGAHKFLDRYEMSVGYGDKNPGILKERKDAARQIYNTYAGQGRTKNTNSGSAARALNSMNGYVETGYNVSGTNSVRSNNRVEEVVDYKTFLQTIIAVLVKISDNTALLSGILELLSDKLDLNINKDDIIKSKNDRAKAERALSDIISRNGGSSNMSKIINNKDTSYLLSAMAAIASE